jgi:hypothetical protein
MKIPMMKKMMKKMMMMKKMDDESDDEDTDDEGDDEEDDDEKDPDTERLKVMVQRVSNEFWPSKLRQEGNGMFRGFEYVIRRRSESEFAVCKAARKSAGGWATYLEGAPITVKRRIMDASTAKEAELMAAVSCAQDMLHAQWIMASMELKVEMPMRLEIDNKGMVDLINNWNVGGRTRRIKRRQKYLRGLIELGMLQVSCVSADLFTNTLSGPLCIKHRVMMNGEE